MPGDPNECRMRARRGIDGPVNGVSLRSIQGSATREQTPAVRVDRRHVTSAAQRIEPHDRVADVQLRTRPLTFLQTVDAADDDVRAQTPEIAPEGGDGAIGRNEERENIEAIQSAPGFQPRIVACCAFDERQRLRTVPRMAVDEWMGACVKRSVQPKESVLPPGRAHAFRSTYAHNPVAWNTACPYRRG